MKLSGTPKLHVRILSPTQTYYDGPALSVSASNKIGPFDILEGHANFFSMLEGGSAVVNNGFQSLSFPVNKGIIKVKNNVVTLFVDIEPSFNTVEKTLNK